MARCVYNNSCKNNKTNSLKIANSTRVLCLRNRVLSLW